MACIFALQFWRKHSSAGSEHLPYKQRVRGSIPCASTEVKRVSGNWNPFLFCGYSVLWLCKVIREENSIVLDNKLNLLRMRKYIAVLLTVILLTPANLYAAPSYEYVDRGSSWLIALLFSFFWLLITGYISWSANTKTRGKRIISIVLTTINVTLALITLYTLIRELPQQRANDGFGMWAAITSLVICILFLLAIKGIIRIVQYYK